MPEITDAGLAGEYLDLQAVSGGGMGFTYIGTTGEPVFGWSMSHSQAITFAARVFGILGYREVHLRDDHTISSAS